MNNRNYIIGIVVLSAIIIVSWLVSGFGSENYTLVDMATATPSTLNLGATTNGIENNMKVGSSTTP